MRWFPILWILVGCTPDPDADGDGDGYPASEDCDDADPAINPGATEVFYDGVDDNCTSLDDDDADGDGWASDAHGGDDCDDGDAAVNPYAEEVCGDGVDNDCDGLSGTCLGLGTGADELEVSVSGTYLEDRVGGGVGAAADLTGDGVPDWVVAAPGIDTSLSNHGRVWVFEGPVQSSVSFDDAVARIDGDEAGEQLGHLLGVPDLDGDGHDELVVASPEGTGEIYVISGGDAAGEVDRGEVAAVWTAPRTDDEAGTSLSVGDVTGDGFADLIVGAPYGRAGSTQSGVAWVVDGRELLDGGDLTDGWQLDGELSTELTGSAVAVLGDIDGDGFSDVGVGRRGKRVVESFAGQVAVVLGPIDSDLDLTEEAEALWSSSGDHPQVGSALVGVGDADGDGRDDWFVGGRTWADGELGCVWLVTETGSGEHWLEDDAAGALQGTEDGAKLGAALAAGGDLDGDGQPDVLVSAPEALGGAVWLVSSDVEGTSPIADVAWAQIAAVGEQDALGEAIAVLGDLDGDGFDDFTVGAPGQAVDEVTGAGVAYLVYGDAGW